VFSSELLGDATLLTVRAGDALVAVKAGPADGREMDTPVALRFDAAKIHVFDPVTGARRP
jgi:multiple sugar transport system ATP-binding protein